MMTPMMKMQVLTMIAYFREMISAMKPAYWYRDQQEQRSVKPFQHTSVPAHAPSSSMEVNQPFFVWSVVYTPIWLLKVVIVKMPEKTPWL